MIEFLLSSLTRMFGKLKVSWNEFEHCGIMYEREASGKVSCHQNHYAQTLKPVDLCTVDSSRPLTPLSASQHSDYLSLLGGLAWLVFKLFNELRQNHAYVICCAFALL